jgi:ribonuclease E
VGQVKTAESMAIEVMRSLQKLANHPDVRRLIVEVQQRVADYLINRKRRAITKLEEEYNVAVTFQTAVHAGPEHLVIRRQNEIGAEVPILGHEGSYSS